MEAIVNLSTIGGADTVKKRQNLAATPRTTLYRYNPTQKAKTTVAGLLTVFKEKHHKPQKHGKRR